MSAPAALKTKTAAITPGSVRKGITNIKDVLLGKRHLPLKKRLVETTRDQADATHDVIMAMKSNKPSPNLPTLQTRMGKMDQNRNAVRSLLKREERKTTASRGLVLGGGLIGTGYAVKSKVDDKTAAPTTSTSTLTLPTPVSYNKKTRRAETATVAMDPKTRRALNKREAGKETGRLVGGGGVGAIIGSGLGTLAKRFSKKLPGRAGLIGGALGTAAGVFGGAMKHRSSVDKIRKADTFKYQSDVNTNRGEATKDLRKKIFKHEAALNGSRNMSEAIKGITLG